MLLYRVFCISLVVGVLGACGFQPLYYRDGERSSIREDMTSVFVRPIKDRIGQDLRNNLKDALDPTGVGSIKKWDLSVKLSKSVEQISVESTSFSTRANLTVSASITLSPSSSFVDLGEGIPKTHKATIRAISSYNIVDSDYADIVAQRDARSRAVVSLSDDIRRQVAMWLRGVGE